MTAPAPNLPDRLEMLSLERLKEILHYCPALGLWWWKERPADSRKNRAFNAQWAGKIAGKRNEFGYVIIHVDGKMYPAHRLAWFYMTGEWPEAVVDHKNKNKEDNEWLNLRPATISQNAGNVRSRTSLPKGIFQRKSGRFEARIMKDGIRHHLGTYDTAEQAGEAYAKAANELFGEFACAA